MKKDVIIGALAKNLGVKHTEAGEIFDKVMETVEEVLVEYKEAPLGKLGKLQVVERAARKGRNPATGEEIEIVAKGAAKYSPSKYLKDILK